MGAAIVGAVGALLVGVIGGLVANHQNNKTNETNQAINEQNIELAKDTQQKEQENWDKQFVYNEQLNDLQQENWQKSFDFQKLQYEESKIREDTAMQRKTQDLINSGLSPLAMGGIGSGVTTVSSPSSSGASHISLGNNLTNPQALNSMLSDAGILQNALGGISDNLSNTTNLLTQLNSQEKINRKDNDTKILLNLRDNATKIEISNNEIQSKNDTLSSQQKHELNVISQNFTHQIKLKELDFNHSLTTNELQQIKEPFNKVGIPFVYTDDVSKLKENAENLKRAMAQLNIMRPDSTSFLDSSSSSKGQNLGFTAGAANFINGGVNGGVDTSQSETTSNSQSYLTRNQIEAELKKLDIVIYYTDYSSNGRTHWKYLP